MKFFTCVRCIRRQAQAAAADEAVGISQEDAVFIGWQFEPEVLCPFCVEYLRGPERHFRERKETP